MSNTPPPKETITQIAEIFDQNTPARLIDKLLNMVFGKKTANNTPTYPFSDTIYDRWGSDFKSIIKPIEETLFEQASNYEIATQHGVLDEVVLEIERVQYDKLSNFLRQFYQSQSNQNSLYFVGDKLKQDFQSKTFNAIPYFKNNTNLSLSDNFIIKIVPMDTEYADFITSDSDFALSAYCKIIDLPTPQQNINQNHTSYNNDSQNSPSSPTNQPTNPVPNNNTDTALIVLTIHDARGKREASIRHLPAKIGKMAQQGINLVVDGQYVSGEHFTIYKENGQLMLEDHSKNGTFVNGKTLHNQSTILNEKDSIQLSKIEPQKYGDYPVIIINKVLLSTNATSTPAVTPFVVPITPTLKENDKVFSVPNTPTPPIFRILVTAGGYKKIIDIFELPCLIGREPLDKKFKSKVMIPSYIDKSNPNSLEIAKDNENLIAIDQQGRLINSASREHVTINQFDGRQAQLTNLGDYGCTVNDKTEYDTFVVTVDQPITIGADFEAPTITLIYDQGCAL